VVGVASSSYDYETPRPLWSEQQPELWWTGTVNSIRQLLAETGIAPTAIRHRPHRADARPGAAGQKRRKCCARRFCGTTSAPAPNVTKCGRSSAKQRLIAITGNDALTGFTAPKILWVKNNEPEIYGRIAHILLPKDYVRYN
jgi:xylulokinase